MERAPEIVTLPFKELELHDRNYRMGDIDAIRASIRQNGFVGVIVAQRRATGRHRIVVGNHRMQAALREGVYEGPVQLLDITDEQALRLLAADNITSDRAQNDGDMLDAIFRELAATPSGLLGTGIHDSEAADLLRMIVEGPPPERAVETEEPDPDKADELQKLWGVQPGDVWIANGLRIVCGDCTDPAVVEKAMGGETAQMCWTDPPWNVAYGKNDNPRYKQREIQNDDLGAEFGKFARDFCASIASVLDPGAAIYMVMSAQEWPVIDAALRAAAFHWSSTIIWAKDRLVLSRKDYHTRYEPMWYGWLEGAARLVPLDDRKQDDVWEIPRPSRSDEHPTMKPVELCQRAIANSSREGDLVFEPFCGSGSTMVACWHTQRRCAAIDLEPKYVAVTLDRLERLGAKWGVVEAEAGDGARAAQAPAGS